MLRLVIAVDAEMEEVPGMKELLCMALESVQGVRVRGVIEVCENES